MGKSTKRLLSIVTKRKGIVFSGILCYTGGIKTEHFCAFLSFTHQEET